MHTHTYNVMHVASCTHVIHTRPHTHTDLRQHTHARTHTLISNCYGKRELRLSHFRCQRKWATRSNYTFCHELYISGSRCPPVHSAESTENTHLTRSTSVYKSITLFPLFQHKWMHIQQTYYTQLEYIWLEKNLLFTYTYSKKEEPLNEKQDGACLVHGDN